MIIRVICQSFAIKKRKETSRKFKNMRVCIIRQIMHANIL